MGYLPCPRIKGTYESSTVVREVVGMVGTGCPLGGGHPWLVAVRGHSWPVIVRGVVDVRYR